MKIRGIPRICVFLYVVCTVFFIRMVYPGYNFLDTIFLCEIMMIRCLKKRGVQTFMKVKNPGKGDLEQLIALETETFPEAEAASRESIERRLRTHRETFWVLKKDGRIIAGINGITTNEKDLSDDMYSGEDLYDKKGSWLMIFGVSTLPEYQHNGYASVIMREVLQEAARCKLEGVVLTCKKELIPFYEQFGFVDEGISGSQHGGATWHQMRLKRSDIKRNYKSEIIDCIVTVAIAAVLAFLLGHFVILNCNVPTGSMLETIQLDDNIIGSRLTYKFSDPKRGDIAIFKWPDDETQVYIKRIIGLPGETVEIKDGKVYIDGSDTPLQEDYLSDGMYTAPGNSEVYEVPENCYFMLGDNRTNSADSRFWEHTYVKREKILAKAEFVYFPLSQITWLGDGAEY